MAATKKNKSGQKSKATWLHYLNYAIMGLENNKLFAGLLILVVNIGSKYVALDFSKTQEEYLKRVKNLNSDIALVKRANMYLENGKKLRDFRGNKYKKNRFYSYACNDYQKASQLGNKKAKNWLSSENGKVCNNSYYVNDYINNSL